MALRGVALGRRQGLVSDILRSKCFPGARTPRASAAVNQIRAAHQTFGCDWRTQKQQDPGHHEAVELPPGYLRYRDQLSATGAPLSFTPRSGLRLTLRKGCIGDAAMSGRHARGAVVSPGNKFMCGNANPHGWWFKGRKNVDGKLRELGGNGLDVECDRLTETSGGTEAGAKLAVSSARSTGGHQLSVVKVIHTLGPQFNTKHAGPQQLKAAYKNCFEMAQSLSMETILLPAISCGIYGFPYDIGANAAFDAVTEMSVDDGFDVRLVEFVLLEDQAFIAFSDAAYVRWN